MASFDFLMSALRLWYWLVECVVIIENARFDFDVEGSEQLLLKVVPFPWGRWSSPQF